MTLVLPEFQRGEGGRCVTHRGDTTALSLARSHDAFGPGLPPPPPQDKEIDRHEPRAKVMQVRVELSVISTGGEVFD